MTLRSMIADDHECDEASSQDVDICTNCLEHSSFCSQCGLSNCCGARSPYLD